MIFSNRSEAGRALAARLSNHADHPDVLILALPRGGVPVAYELAIALNAPLDVFLVRKLGVPGHEELAFGALASGGTVVQNETLVKAIGLDAATIRSIVDREAKVLESRERLYRGGQPMQPVDGKTILLVDDGVATGATMRAAIAALRSRKPARIVVAIPVAADETCRMLATVAEEVVCVASPEPFHSVGAWYDDFSQTSDAEVRELLQRAQRVRRRLVA